MSDLHVTVAYQVYGSESLEKELSIVVVKVNVQMNFPTMVL